jgi:methylthioribose-1-phosphate isomerase
MHAPSLADIERYLSPSFRTIEWRDGRVILLDQRRLPQEEVYLELGQPEEVASAIRDLAIRGAPAIGVAAAMGIALAARAVKARNGSELRTALKAHMDLFLRTRPTAVNLRWAVDRMGRRAEEVRGEEADAARKALEDEAIQILVEDVLTNVAIGEAGSQVVASGARILTHCNAGALATGGYGTALGVVRSAHRQGKGISVLADETRPFLQGARLTAWELQKDGIPVIVITDSMAGHFMKKKEVSVIIVGADRVAANGDVANKIGTYSLAILAREHGIPFYVAAPLSTFDPTLATGEAIPIEERDPREVLEWGPVRMAPEGVSARYPAFDVTPHPLISGIITEQGILSPPLGERIRSLLPKARPTT